MLRETIDIQVRRGEEVVIRLRNPLRGVDGGEAGRHAYQAGREALLAVRSLLDAAIERVGRREQRAAGGRQEIRVE
ncbi:MAG TPA: hypothetical protein VIO14_14525 [Dehalococcoidia bacterium]